MCERYLDHFPRHSEYVLVYELVQIHLQFRGTEQTSFINFVNNSNNAFVLTQQRLPCPRLTCNEAEETVL